MSDVLSLLPLMQWRGTAWPIASRSVTFAHDGVTHHLQYRDNEIVEQVGAQNLTFSYRIPVREGIAKGPYVRLFTEKLPILYRDMHNREPGDLVDPVLGQFQCVPTSYNDTTDVNQRDGTDVTVEFKLAPDLDDAEDVDAPSLQGALDEAGRFDGEIARANWHQEPSPLGTTDFLSAINGLLSTGQRSIDKINASVHGLADRIEKIENTIDRTKDPNNWHFRATARRVRADILTLQRQTGNGNPLTVVKLHGQMPIAAVASEFGMSVQELLAENPGLAANPMVQPGTRVRVRRRTR